MGDMESFVGLRLGLENQKPPGVRVNEWRQGDVPHETLVEGFNDGNRTGESLLSHQCGEYAAARTSCIREGLHIAGITDPIVPCEREIMARSNADRVGHLLRCEPYQPACHYRGREARAGVLLKLAPGEGVCQPRLDLVPQNRS